MQTKHPHRRQVLQNVLFELFSDGIERGKSSAGNMKGETKNQKAKPKGIIRKERKLNMSKSSTLFSRTQSCWQPQGQTHFSCSIRVIQGRIPVVGICHVVLCPEPKLKTNGNSGRLWYVMVAVAETAISCCCCGCG